ncbi:MAG: OmpA family protein [Chitinophagaceae bacterium]|nr:MAG: OmpA family protein [Chitinophagaceae bacterium]
MKKILFATLLLMPALVNAQSLFDRVKQKAKARVDQQVDKGIDRALDGAQGNAEKAVKTESAPNTEAAPESETEAAAPKAATPASAQPAFRSYSRYDFVPGADIVFAEDFAQDVVGEFPLQWGTNNRGEAVTIEGFDGKWLRMFKEGKFVSPAVKSLPANFTMEFDVVLNLPPNTLHSNYPQLDIMLLALEAGADKTRKYLNGQLYPKADLELMIAPYPNDDSKISIETHEARELFFSKHGRDLPLLGASVNKRTHFAFWIQGTRLRLWINGEKVYDLPQAMPTSAPFTHLAFETHNSPYNDEQVGYYLSNIRFAQGAPDLRSKFLAEGRFATSGIQFDAGSDAIKPESAGVLAEIAALLKENATLRVKIIGHTDSDGEDAKNLTLSKARAAAIKNALSSQYGIDAARMDTDGKGEGQPAGPNTTPEGKAKNRRVEFVRL